ncbi:MAG: 5-bromo-4-chloroindolyl phosphate hydrolysis family protein [Gammaproteobacteria bacterium]|nr:5-bromo-4-chloroindolyl phosphate hydrolysis family protein [Gammaproteobacteria bacterium]
MAKRYNPDKPRPSALAGIWLYILSLPLLPATLTSLMAGQSQKTIVYGIGFVMAMVAATMMRKGIGIAAEAKSRRILRRTSTVPYKMTASVIMALAMFIVAWMGNGYSLIEGVLFGLSVFIGAYLFYGFDPSRENPDISTIGITSEEVIELLDEAEEKIAAIDSARGSLRNREFRDRLRRITDEAREILVTIEEDPRDARRARKFLKVYLDGTQQVTEGYAKAHRDEDNPALEDNFRRVLDTIETVIADQQQKLRQNNLTELDVQIEVLQMQLEKEGVT